MKLLALNSSPRDRTQSKTEMMLNPLVKGMRDAGAHVEVVHLRKKTIKNCLGCFTCWTKTPGVCIHKDDMTNELFPKWLDSDIVVYATPLYHYTVNAAMKAFIERTLPVAQPFFERHQGRIRHPLRQQPPASVVLSVAGFPEASVFGQLSAYVNFLFGERLLAEIYRPAAESLAASPYREIRNEILAATEQAGRELVASRGVSKETMARITQPVIRDLDAFARIGNLMWKTCIAEGITPRELQERGLVPRPDSIETFMMIMPMGFNPEGADDTQAVMQFNFSGEVEGACYFKIEHGTIQAVEGKSDKPDLMIDAPFDVWMDIMTGKADGQKMFMEHAYTATGDLSLLMRIKDLFGKKRREL